MAENTRRNGDIHGFATGNNTTRIKATHITDSVADSPLFKLSPELRNAMYRLVLIDQEDGVEISKTHGIPEPALMTTCKLVRSESHSIFYQENIINHYVEMYDTAPIDFILHKLPAGCWRGAENVRLVLDWNPCWKNLVSWLQAFRRQEYIGIGATVSGDGKSAEVVIVQGLFNVASQSVTVSSEAFECVLESMHSALLAVESDWAK